MHILIGGVGGVDTLGGFGGFKGFVDIDGLGQNSGHLSITRTGHVGPLIPGGQNSGHLSTTNIGFSCATACTGARSKDTEAINIPSIFIYYLVTL